MRGRDGLGQLPTAGHRVLHLFSGAGGGILADVLLGNRPICAVEINSYCQEVLQARQKDGALPWFPIWDDVKTFDGTPWRGRVDCIAGGFPCIDVSEAKPGNQNKGVSAGEHSGLWREFARIVDEVKPTLVFIENSPALVRRGLNLVLGDLARLGYDARWGVLGAWHFGGAHIRQRIFVLAYPSCQQACLNGQHPGLPQVGQAPQNQLAGSGSNDRVLSKPPKLATEARAKKVQGFTKAVKEASQRCWDGSRLARVSYGLAHWLDRHLAVGNGIVPTVTAAAYLILSQGVAK